VRELNDPYSELLAPKANEEFNRNVGGRYGGVGMLLEEQKPNGITRIVVARVVPHTPAEEGGYSRATSSPKSTPWPCRATSRSTKYRTPCAAPSARR
jgi:hypothetical protein